MLKFGSPALMAYIVKDGKMLALQYSSFYGHPEVDHKYVLPGGRPNEGETIHETLIREVREETGLDVTIKDPIHLDLFVNSPNGKVRPILFLGCDVVGGEGIQLSGEHQSYKWVRPEEARSLDWVNDCFVRFLDKVNTN